MKNEIPTCHPERSHEAVESKDLYSCRISSLCPAVNNENVFSLYIVHYALCIPERKPTAIRPSAFSMLMLGFLAPEAISGSRNPSC